MILVNFSVLVLLLCNLNEISETFANDLFVFRPELNQIQTEGFVPWPKLQGNVLRRNFRAAENTNQSIVNFKDSVLLPSSSDISSTNDLVKNTLDINQLKRKQYEVFNVLWRKTKIFVEIENTTRSLGLKTNKLKSSKPNKSTTPFKKIMQKLFLNQFRSSTPSSMEFYYMDDIHTQNSKTYKTARPRNEQPNFTTTEFPFFLFHFKYPPISKSTGIKPATCKTVKHATKTLPLSVTATRNKGIKPTSTGPVVSSTSKIFVKRSGTCRVVNSSKITALSVVNTTLLDSTSQLSTIPDATTNASVIHIPISTINEPTVYDKIKFFEMYDDETVSPYHYSMKDDNNEEEIQTDEKKINLEMIDETIGNQQDLNKTRNAKKYTRNSDSEAPFNNNAENGNMYSIFNVTSEERFVVKRPEPRHQKGRTNKTQDESVYSNNIESAAWRQYPFAAVYIYDKLHVHCDAAAISQHWLVASASCLTQHRKLTFRGRTAFVAYCGDSWLNPELIAYVKYSIIHPNYNHRDQASRLLYNIGVIQVVTSMASSCNGWAPVTLMSHQFVAEHDGSPAAAVGWGLDRYGTTYDTFDLPSSTLMVYKSLIFSESCPGTNAETKRMYEEEGVRNAYCLSLPPYAGEAREPVHGSLLLVGGKLIALYLQEERRAQGLQSAVYTGVWKLVPWVMEAARERDDIDVFTMDI